MSIQKSTETKLTEPKVIAVKRELIVDPNATVTAVNTTGSNAVVVTEPARVPAVPAKPGEVIGGKHHHGRPHGHKAEIATVATERDLLDDVARHRAALVGTIDELHTRLSPKYQIDQLKSTWTQAGTDALAILKNEGSPVDETRKKKAEGIIKAGGALSGLVALGSLRKVCKRAKIRRTVRKAVNQGMPKEHLDIVGVVEGVEGEGLGFLDDASPTVGSVNPGPAGTAPEGGSTETFLDQIADAVADQLNL